MPETETKTKHKKSNFAPIYLSDEDDTIDLLELLKILWKKRYLIIVFTIVAFFGSFSYLFLQPSYYKIETVFDPLDNNNYQILNDQLTKILKEVNDDNTDLTIEMYEQLKSNVVSSTLHGLLKNITVNNNIQLRSNLVSSTLKNGFINTEGVKEIWASEGNLGTNDINIISGLLNKLVVNNNKISLVSNNPEIATKVLNNYVKFIESITSRQLVDNVGKSFTEQINQTDKKINVEMQHIISQQKYQKILRENKIKEYEEAIIIASKLGIKDKIKSINSVQNLALYTRGTRALQAELDVIRKRKYNEYLNSKEKYTKLENHNKLLEDKINEYEEAIIIASKLGTVEIENWNIKSKKSLPLYTRGTRALQVELDVIRERKYKIFSNSKENLSNLVGTRKLLRTIKKEISLIQSKTIYLYASSTRTTIINKKYSIILLITLIGLFFGIMLTFFIEFVHINTKPVEKAEKDN